MKAIHNIIAGLVFIMVPVISVVSCDPNPDVTPFQQLSFSEAIGRLPSPESLGPAGLASASKAMKPFTNVPDDPVLVSEMYIEVFQNGSMDATVASVYGEMRRLLGTLPEDTTEMSRDFGVDEYLGRTVAMSWSSTDEGFRVLATLSKSDNPTYNYTAALNICGDGSAFAFDMCMNYSVPGEYSGFYISTYDENDGRFNIYSNESTADQSEKSIAVYEVQRSGDGTLDYSAYVTDIASGDLESYSHYGYASPAGAVYAYYYPVNDWVQYFDSDGMDFYTYREEKDIYRMSSMSSYPDNIYYDEYWENTVFIDADSNGEYNDVNDTLITEGVIQATYASSVSSGVYVPMHTLSTRYYRPYLQLVHDAALPTYAGTQFVLKAGLPELKAELGDMIVSSRADAFVDKIRNRDCAPFIAIMDAAVTYSYP